MRVVVLVSALLLVPAGAAFADKDIGCGFGTQLLEGKEGMWFKVLGATINGSSGNQTFGISFGTLGCAKDGTITAQERVQLFAGANLDRLAHDMAYGEGESLGALAHLLGIPADSEAAFNGLARDHFASLYPTDDVTAGDMLATLYGLMQQDPSLAPYALG